MRRMKFIIFIASMIFSFSALQSIAFALTQDQKDCVSNDPDLQIRGCTNYIKSGRASQNNKAIAYFNLGNAYHKKGQFDIAIANYSESIKLDPDYAPIYNNRGTTYEKIGQLDLAIADFSQTIKLNPLHIGALNNRGNIYRDNGQYDQAIADYNKALRIDPKSALVYINRGLVYSNKGQYDRAIADYSRVIKLNPKFADAYNKRGVAYERKRQYDLAISNYNQALKLFPKFAGALFNRGVAYGRKGEIDIALNDYSQALKLNPKLIDAYTNRGNLFYEKGQHERAISDYTQAIKLNPKDEAAHHNRGKIFAILGRKEEAIKDLRKAVSLAPGNKKIKASLEKTLNTKSAKLEVEKKAKFEVEKPDKKEIKPHSTGRRLALVIGIDSYINLPSGSQLKKAKNDARSVSKAFTNLGFEVIDGFDLKRREMNVLLSKLSKQIEPGDEVAFFFAGHGVRIDGLNYLLPADIPAIQNTDAGLLKAEALRVDTISDRFRREGARLSLLILDACRNNPYKDNRGRSVGGTRGLAPMDPPEGTLVMFSAGAGQEALDRLSDDDANPNSIFTRTILPLLNKNDLELSRLARLVKAKVRDLAKSIGHKQTPAVYNEVIGDVYLVRK